MRAAPGRPATEGEGSAPMAGFRFRLQRLLDVRQAGTRDRARDLGAARAAESGAAGRADETARWGMEHLARLRGEAGVLPLDLDAWQAGRDRYRSLRGAEAEARAELRQAQQRTDAARGAFLDARKDERVLERLRERRQGEWEVRAAAAAQAALDEAAARRGPAAPEGEGAG